MIKESEVDLPQLDLEVLRIFLKSYPTTTFAIF